MDEFGGGPAFLSGKVRARVAVHVRGKVEVERGECCAETFVQVLHDEVLVLPALLWVEVLADVCPEQRGEGAGEDRVFYGLHDDSVCAGHEASVARALGERVLDDGEVDSHVFVLHG